MTTCIDPDDGLVCEPDDLKPLLDAFDRWMLRILAASSAVTAALLLNALRHCHRYRRTN